MKNNILVKVLVVVLFCAVFGMGVNAQNTFSKGDIIGNIGIGLGSTFSHGSSVPISGSLELGVLDNLFDDKSSLGVGGYVGFASEKWWDIRWTYIIFGVRGAVHYQFVDKLDTYLGLMLGYNNVSVSSSYSEGSLGGGFTMPFFIGGRYYFTDKIGGFAELGHGIAYLQLGVSIKF